MCCHTSNKTAYPEPEQTAVEAVETVTVAGKETKKDNNSDNRSSSPGSVNVVNEEKVTSSYSKSSAKSQDEEEVYDGSSKKSGEADVETTGGFEMCKFTDADKTRFKDMVNRHASSLTLNLIMLAIRVTIVKTNCGS